MGAYIHVDETNSHVRGKQLLTYLLTYKRDDAVGHCLCFKKFIPLDAVLYYIIHIVLCGL